MVIVAIALAALSLAQQPADAKKPEVAVLKAGLGACSADFVVKDADGKPVYAANIHVRVRYGAFGIKRSDLEVGTNVEGKARIEGLPDKARPLTYDITKGELKGTVEQNLAENCHATSEVSLK